MHTSVPLHRLTAILAVENHVRFYLIFQRNQSRAALRALELLIGGVNPLEFPAVRFAHDRARYHAVDTAQGGYIVRVVLAAVIGFFRAGTADIAFVG